jgi:MFS family permease
MGMMGGIFLIPIFASTYLGLDATQTGLLFMPMACMMMLFSPLGGQFAGRVQPRYIIAISTLVAAFGLYLFSYLDPRSTVWDIMIPLSVMAAGLGFGMAQRTSLIASIVPENEVGIASSVLALVRNIAGAFGIALFGTILSNATETNVLNLAHNSVLRSLNPSIIGEFTSLIILKAQVLAYSTVFQISALIVLVGAGLALFIKVEHKKNAAEVFID